MKEAVKDRDVVGDLNNLIQLDVDAIKAYDQAIEACEHASVKIKLTEFRADHQRHITDLSAHVRALGAEPEVKQDLKGYLIEGFTAITSIGTHSALVSMQGNEVLTNKSYQSALKKDFSPEIRATLERNFSDEQRHLSWIKEALRLKAWEREAKAA